VAGLAAGPRRRRGEDADGVGRGAGQRPPQALVDRLHRAHRVRDQVVVADVMEPRRIVPGALRREPRQAAGPQVKLRAPDHGTGENRRPARGGVGRQAARGRDRRARRAVRLDDERVRVDGEQGVQGEQVTGVLEYPPPARVGQADHLEVAPVPPVRLGPVLIAQPGRVAGHVREGLERYRAHGLLQQLPAFLDLVGRHVVHAHELGVLLMVLGEARLNVVKNNVVAPGISGRAGLRHLGEPHLQALAGGVRGEQPVQRRGAGPRQPGDEDRAVDADLGVFRVRLPGGLAAQPGHQDAAQQRPLCLRAGRRELRVGREGVEQHREPVGVVIRAEVGQARAPRRGRVQVLGRTDGVGRFGGVGRDQWWYSPQLTSRHWPVMARAIGEARNTTASAISSGSGSRPRSTGAAVSA